MNPYESMDPEERTARAQMAAHESWAKTTDRAARTKTARDALLSKFANEADPDGALTPEQAAAAARSRQHAHMARMRMAKATKARQARQAAEAQTEDVA